jgi:hypothetical protein
MVLIPLFVLAILYFVDVSWVNPSGDSRVASGSSSTSSTTLSSTTTSTAASSTSTSTSQPSGSDASPAWKRLDQFVSKALVGRHGVVEIAVENLSTNVVWSYGSSTPQDEASIVKVDILATLLADASRSARPLSSNQSQLAQSMIEESDNDSATTLWTQDDGSSGIGEFNKGIELTHTVPSLCVVCSNFPWPGWGLTTTTPRDQIKLLDALVTGSGGLSREDGRYELGLMQSVVSSERWGASNGVPKSATVSLKNGWLPLNDASSDWQINSIGWVRGDGRDYLIAMLSTGNPSEEYGIQTLGDVSSQVWAHIG